MYDTYGFGVPAALVWNQFVRSIAWITARKLRRIWSWSSDSTASIARSIFSTSACVSRSLRGGSKRATNSSTSRAAIWGWADIACST